MHQRTEPGAPPGRRGGMGGGPRADAVPSLADVAGAREVTLALALVVAGDALARAQAALRTSRARELALQRQLDLDALTGLPNRMAFGRRSSRAIAAHALSRKGFGVLFIDLDGFKSINDRLGHAMGDALLGVVGDRLAHALRADDFVSRHGGDEFVCLLPGIDDIARAKVLARKLIDAISAPCELGGRVERIGASVGVAMYPQDGSSVAELLDRADRAMLWAKVRSLGIGVARRCPDAVESLAARPRTQPLALCGRRGITAESFCATDLVRVS